MSESAGAGSRPRRLDCIQQGLDVAADPEKLGRPESSALAGSVFAVTSGVAERTELRIELSEPDELFEPGRSAVAEGRPASEAGIDRIRSELSAAPRREALRLTIVLPRQHVTPRIERGIRDALRHYCDAGIRHVENDLRAIWRDGWQTFLAGLVILGVGLVLSEAVLNSGWPKALRTFFGDGLFLVIAWVGLWYPLDTLVYAGRPFRVERKVLRAINGAEVALRSSDQDAT
jgi:hypothetical protein